jgi:Fe2+ transport system protein B
MHHNAFIQHFEWLLPGYLDLAWWALSLYAIDLMLMFAVVKIAVKVVPGELTGLIMEMHSFKVPSLF